MMSNNRAEVKKVRDKYYSKKYIFFRLIFDDIHQLEFHTISRHHLHGVYGLNPAHVGIDGWMNGLLFFIVCGISSMLCPSPSMEVHSSGTQLMSCLWFVF